MTDIDFLPSEYKDRCALRRAQPVEIMLACIMTASLIAASFVFIRHREKATEALVRIKPSYETAIAQRSRLTAMENELNRADAKAELLAYLRHPLAKSQLLTAIASKLPDDVILRQVRIAPEKINNSPGALRASPDDGRVSGIAEKDRLDAEKDLRVLWEKEQQEQTLVEITGSASDIASIHRFVKQHGGLAPVRPDGTDFSPPPKRRQEGSDPIYHQNIRSS